jgi:hypothetical protein
MNTTLPSVRAIFDTSFSHFVTLGLVKVLYGLAIVVVAVATVVVLIGGLMDAGSFFQGILILIFTPIIAGVYLLAIRIGLELIIVVFRIGETAKEVRDLLASKSQS